MLIISLRGHGRLLEVWGEGRLLILEMAALKGGDFNFFSPLRYLCIFVYMPAWVGPVARLWVTPPHPPLFVGCFCYLLR